MSLKELEKIVNEREKILEKLHEYVGALEELTFLWKNKHLPENVFTERFDKIKAMSNKLSDKFQKLGESIK